MHPAVENRNRKPRNRKPWKPWTEDEESLLGVDSDSAVGRRLGRSRMSILLRRRKLGITAAHRRSGHRSLWTEEEDAMLWSAADSAVAKATGRTLVAVSHRRRVVGAPRLMSSLRRWTDEEIGMLAFATNREIAILTGRTPEAVATKRLAAGVPSPTRSTDRGEPMNLAPLWAEIQALDPSLSSLESAARFAAKLAVDRLRALKEKKERETTRA